MASKIIVDQLQKSGLTALTLPLANATANQHLKNDGAGALSWGTGGKVLQLLEDNVDTNISTTSTSYVASGLTITITPASASSKFLLTLSGGCVTAAAVQRIILTTFYVDGVEVSPAGPYSRYRESDSGVNSDVPHSAACLHSPATTSPVIYTVYYKSSPSGEVWFSNAGNRIVFTAMELSS